MWTPPFFPRITTWLKTGISNIEYEFKPLHIFAFIGIVAVLYLVERTVDFVFFHFATPREALQGYKRRGPKPTYALITGASAGIGFGIAKALVKQGFGVILLGHKPDELAEAARALRSELVLPKDADPVKVPVDEYVKTIVMNATYATPEEMEAKLRETIIDPGLRVSILVNNVGGEPCAPPPTRSFASFSPDDIDDTIALNARFPARLTALMLPVIIHRGSGVDAQGISFGTHRRSLILNVSSGGMVGIPYVMIYCAAKSFVWSFSRGLARELEADPSTRHVDVLGILPGDTRTQSNVYGVSKWAPDANKFGQCVVDKADGAIARGWREMQPHWLQHLQMMMLNLLPEKTATKFLLQVMKAKRSDWEAAHTSKDE